MGFKEIERLYLEKYNLSEKSNKMNIRVLERSLFYKNNKIDNKLLNINKEVLIKKLKNINISYNDLVLKLKLCRRSNNKVNSNFKDIKELEIVI
jgi:hypothetical protein